MEHLENAAVQVTTIPRRRQRPRLPTDAQARRVEELRRAFQRRLKRRPTLIEKAAMLRSAALVARAEALALDPNADVNEVVKLNNLAGRVLHALGIKLDEPPKRSRGLEIARARWAEQERQRLSDAKRTDASTGVRAAAETARTDPPDDRAE